MDLNHNLKSIGLNASEITVYLFLLENGLSTPPIVSRGTKIARTNCYNILQSLKEKDLILEQIVKNKKTYLASDPESLLRGWQKKKETIEQIIPDLRSLYKTQKNKPKIRFYEGVGQIKEIYRLSLEAKQIMALGSTNKIEQLMPGFLDEYFTEIKKRGIIFYDLLTADSKSIAGEDKNLLKGLYEFKLLPSEYKDQPTDILIWDNNIALSTLEEPVFATVLTHKPLADTFKMIFSIIRNRI